MGTKAERSWTWRTLGDLAVDIRTGPFGSQLHAEEYAEAGVPVVMPQDLATQRIDTAQVARVPDRVAERLSRHVLLRNDIVYARRGNLRRRALVGEEENGWLCGTGCLRVRVSETVHARFIFYALGSPAVTEWIHRHAVGATMPNLNTKILSDCPVPVPSLPEQRAIAQVLGVLDDKIESNQRVMSDCAALLELAHQFATRNAETGTLGDLGAITGGGTPRSGVEGFWAPAEVPWITPSDMTALDGVPLVWQGSRAISRAGLGTSSARLIPQGSVVFTSRATIGLVAIAQQELATNQGFINVVPHPRFSSPFVYSTLRERRNAIAAKANGSTFLEVNKTNFKAVTCRVPSDEELAAHDAVALPALRSMAGLTVETQRLAAIRDALLPRLVSGRLRVPLTNTPNEAVETVLGAA